ncbi:MAG TPA: TIGR03668 family PPOX class F420-dependent oxidoreductase [Ktedonosporobacter sp.]|nr:TIGR03668 family PPOX class F420-dependent oxidoreductase [Ktedonosporobacter sp.]
MSGGDPSRSPGMTPRTTLTAAETRFVQRQRVARLATADESGSPHLIPVCYAFDGNRFYTPLDEKPKRVTGSSLRRVRNIEARHEASLLIDQYDDDWSRLGYVLVHGRADLLPPHNAAHEPALRLLRERYVQYRTMALETQLVIAITPDRVVSWGPAIGGEG